MALIDRPGLFICEIVDHGVSLTNKNKLPQFVATLKTLKYFDDAKTEWVDWHEYDQAITGYFVLVTLDEHADVVKCLNYDQIVKALGWDGESYSSLANGDWKGTHVQIRVTEDVYNGKTTLKASWIDHEDASVGVRKLSGKEVTELDNKFRVATPKKATPASKPAAKPAAKPTGKRTPPKASKPTAKKADQPKVEKPEDCTEDVAYQACIELNEKLGDKRVPDEVLDDYWISNIDSIAKDPDNVTNSEWPQIRNATLSNINIPF